MALRITRAARAGFFRATIRLFPLDPKAQFPCLGPVVAKMLEGRRDPAMPVYVGSATNVYGGGSAGLGIRVLAVCRGGRSQRPQFQSQQSVALPQKSKTGWTTVGFF